MDGRGQVSTFILVRSSSVQGGSHTQSPRRSVRIFIFRVDLLRHDSSVDVAYPSPTLLEMLPHSDRIPLVTSAIVNVAQDVDEDWPLEVYDRFGNAVNVTMEPGDMVFYESHSLIHGRPFALKGRFYANIFIHFEPYDGFGEDSGNVTDGGLPPYILPGSPEEEVWKEDHPFGWSKAGDLSIVHQYVRDGRLDQFKELAALDTRALYFADEYGWQPVRTFFLSSLRYWGWGSS